jgi:fructose/tagatose bisphosphate aldolase
MFKSLTFHYSNDNGKVDFSLLKKTNDKTDVDIVGNSSNGVQFEIVEKAPKNTRRKVNIKDLPSLIQDYSNKKTSKRASVRSKRRKSRLAKSP